LHLPEVSVNLDRLVIGQLFLKLFKLQLGSIVVLKLGRQVNFVCAQKRLVFRDVMLEFGSNEVVVTAACVHRKRLMLLFFSNHLLWQEILVFEAAWLFELWVDYRSRMVRVHATFSRRRQLGN
jgi:hypothetical protein